MTAYRNSSPYRSDILYRGALPAAQRYVYGSSVLPWNTAPKRARSIGTGWRHAAPVRGEPRLVWTHAPVVARSLGLPWALIPRVRRSAHLAWGLPPSLQVSAGVPWRHVPKVTIAVGAPWGLPPVLEHGADLPWRAPPSIEIDAGLPWSTPPVLQCSAGMGWSHPSVQTRQWWLPWQHAPALQWVVHSPGVIPPDDNPPDVYVPPAGDQVAIAFACPQLVFDGDQVPVPFGPAACYFAWPRPRIYIVENSAAVVRLPERTPISVASITLSQGVDDAHWSMAMSLADPASLEWLKADAEGPKVVEITINGYVWTAIVESYKQDRQHPTRKVDVSGRSQTALLDAPYAPLRSKVLLADTLTQQLIDDELALTDFTADYSAVAAQTGIGGWLVPAGAYHYDAQSAIASIKAIAAASGAVVQAHPWDKVLVIAPRYPVSPWNWTATAPSADISDDIILRDSLRPNSKPLFDYVLVSGEQAGVSDPILRDGAAGTVRAPMVVDALMTDHLATRERGRNVLSDRGEQASIDVTIPLFASSVPATPGLILPLQLVQVVEPTSWKAIATAVSISVTIQNTNDVGVLIVEQTVTLERHFTDAN